ncbi:nucleotidyltransferase family protein [Acidobacteriota bacterium]
MTTHSSSDRQQCLDFLTSVCHTWLLKTNPISTPPGLNLAILKKMAYYQGVETILHDLIRQDLLSKNNLPQNLIDHWEKAYFSTLIQNTRFTDLLTQILSKTEEENLPIIALKGMASTALLYKDLGLRPMADIDLLCHTKDLRKLSDILHSLGFQRKGILQAHHIAFHHSNLGILIELHFALQYIVKDKKNLLARFWEHHHWAEIDDARLPILSTEDQLIFETAHILDHVYLVSLKHFLDFAGWLLNDKEEIDWDYLKSHLLQSGMQEDFVLISQVLSEFFQIPMNLPIQNDLPSKKIDDLKNTISTSLSNTGFIQSPLAATRIKSYATLTQKAGFTLRKLFPPLPVIQSTYNISSPISSLFSYPYHIYKTLLDFQSRKKRDEA